MPDTHVPPWQLSPTVHALPSLHVVPFVTGVPVHPPVAGSHVWALRHWVAPGQVTGLPPVHTPPWQVSVCVQALPSLQPVPSARAGFEHSPLDVSHVPTPWH